MAIELTLFNNELLHFQQGLPSNYTGPLLRGARTLSTKSDIAELVVQELTSDHYSIRFSVAKFFKDVIANGNISVQGFYTYFILKNGLRKEIDSIGRLHLRQDQYIGFFTDPSKCEARFKKDIEYRSIDLFYSPKLLEELTPFFPEVKDLLLSSPSAVLPGKACWTLPSMKEITNQLLNCPYDEATSQFYFDLKVRELLYQILQNTYKRKPASISFTPWEIARVHDARKILEGHISNKPPTIRSLSKQVALNEFKLKVGFRQYFNAGIFEWLMEKKMQLAKELILNTNRPIKDICTMVGYPRTTNFITAFRRRFGYTPNSLRRSTK